MCSYSNYWNPKHVLRKMSKEGFIKNDYCRECEHKKGCKKKSIGYFEHPSMPEDCRVDKVFKRGKWKEMESE